MKRTLFTTLVLCAASTWVSPAVAQDVVGYWNERALAAVSQAAPAGRGATPATIIDVTMVHLAMHDAVQAYDKRFEFYAGAIVSGSGSPVVAAAKAARDVLATRFPLQVASLDASYMAFLSSLAPPPSPGDIADGEIVGALAASNVITVRAGDGSFPSSFPQFVGGTAPGQWQPNAGTPGMTAPWAGAVTPFALDSLNRCAVEPPPALTSFEYALNYIEVKLFGSATSRFRTPEQSAIARMYSGNFQLQYNRLFREISAHLTGSPLVRLGKQARLFALTNMAMADAFICSWSTKKEFNFWRPSQAIRRGDEDGNVLTKADSTWTTYFSRNVNAAQDPNYPDYTSGANNLTGAMTRMLELIFESDRPFPSFAIWAANPVVPLEAGDANPRIYRRFSDVADDVVSARIYLGIHFRFADTQARSQGRHAAGYAFRNFLEPLD